MIAVEEQLIPVSLSTINNDGDSNPEITTVVSFEDFGDGLVGFHINPWQRDVITLMFNKEDAWRFIKEMSIVTSSAELT